MQEYAGRPRRKLSEGKATWPGRKQVYRFHRPDGTIAEDIVALVSEPCAGEPLVRPVMRAGRRLPDLPDLARARGHAARSLARLPPPLRQLEVTDVPVRISQGLRDLAASMTT